MKELPCDRNAIARVRHAEARRDSKRPRPGRAANAAHTTASSLNRWKPGMSVATWLEVGSD